MRSILVIDPHPELRRFVVAILTRAGHDVREGHDLRQAPALLRRGNIDLLVTDLAGPSRDGAEMREALQREFPALEVVAISAAPHATGYLRLAATLDAPRTVARPFMSRELMALLNEMVAGVAAYSVAERHRVERALARN